MATTIRRPNGNPEPDETKRFLTTLFGTKDANAGKIVVWSMTGERGDKKVDRPNTFRSKARFASDAGDAARAVAANPEGWNVFACLSILARELGANQRGKASDSVGLVGLWADVDYGAKGHKSSTNPATIQDARAIVDAMGVSPTMIVSSGGGLHAYWLFDTILTFANDAERERAQMLARAWQTMIQSIAATRGVTVDSTHDISRVLRVPGTMNVKPGTEPRPCRILELNDDRRYVAGDLEKLITPAAMESARHLGAKSSLPPTPAAEGKKVAANAAAATRPADEVGPTFIVRPDADPPDTKFTALCANEPRFFESWNRTRRDFAKGTSQSEYDMSLARFAVSANWTDQEIVDLLVACRNKHKESLKRVDYFRRTLLEARTFERKTEALGAIRELSARVTPDDSPRVGKSTPDERSAILSMISDALGVRIVRVVKYNSDPPKYRLVTSRGEIELGTVENLIGQTTIRNAVAASDSVYIAKLKPNDWDAVAQMLLDACETVDVGPESTDRGRVSEWLNIYLDSHRPGLMSNALIANQVPYFSPKEDSSVCFFLSHFREWVFRNQSERLTQKELGILLRKIEVKSEAVRYQNEDGEDTTRNVWCVKHERSGKLRKKLTEQHAENERERLRRSGAPAETTNGHDDGRNGNAVNLRDGV